MNQNQVVTNNIVLNNYITIGNANSQRADPKNGMSQKQVSIDDLMGYFATKYKNILPNRLNMEFDFKTMLFPFEKAQIVELLYQMDVLIQLLVQNFLFSMSEETKFKSYELLMKIYNQKNFVVSFLDYMPTYQIPLAKFKLESMQNQQADGTQPAYNNTCPLYFEIKPQMSILQSPLLELTELFIEIKSKVHSKDKLKETLLYLEPFIQKNWIPVFCEQGQTQGSSRIKFNHIDDSLLLIGLAKYGAKTLFVNRKLELIQQDFLPEKKIPEIKNRYKNLICGRANDNKIKRWKILQFAPLRDDEKLKLQKAIEWFGCAERINLISRYFLVDRSPEFIKAELTGSDKLLKKRKKYANLLNSNLFAEPFPLPTLEIQMKKNKGEETNVPSVNKSSQDGEQMEVEKGANMGDPSQEQFEQITLNFSQEDKGLMDDHRMNHNSLFKLGGDNFETMELDNSFEVSSSDDLVNQFSQNFKDMGMYGKFKRIGSHIFEYEEI